MSYVFLVELTVLGAVVSGGVASWAAFDAARQLMTMRPVRGRVTDASYSEAERLAARAKHPWDWLYKVTAGNAKPVVRDVLTVEYDVAGTRYRRQVETAHLRGDRANHSPMVWYDPDDPGRMTIDGPGGSALVAVIALGFAASLIGWLPSVF